MAEDTVTQAQPGWATAWSQVRTVAERHSALLLTVAFAVSAFAVYWFAGPKETVYNNFVLLADRLRHGHVDIGVDITYLEFSVREGKFYVIPPPMPAIVVLPGVLIFGVALNQTLVSTVLGAINASLVHRITRGVAERVSAHIWLTVMFIFGSVYWYAAANGGVWFFSHTVAVLFLVMAIYVTIVDRRPFWAGLFLGAAYWTRQPAVLALPFFIIMFSDLWLPESRRGEGSLWKRVDLRPLILLGIGLAIFLVLSFIYNYLRFETPLDASQHFRKPEILREPWFNHGPFDLSYVARHVPIFFERLPIFQSEKPYVIPSFTGMAMWATTPAFFYALFAGIKDRRVIFLGAAGVILSLAIIVSRAVSAAWEWDWATQQFKYNVHLWPIYAMIVVAVATSAYVAFKSGFQDRLALACWSAIIPTTLMLFTFAGTGFAQFGYRFSLDFLPFMFLLTAKAIGNDLRWHHKLVILIGVAVNLWGVLWIYHFDPNQYLDLRWVAP